MSLPRPHHEGHQDGQLKKSILLSTLPHDSSSTPPGAQGNGTQDTAGYRFIVALEVKGGRCGQHRCAVVVEGVGWEDKADGAGPGNPRLGPGARVKVTIASPTQKCRAMTPGLPRQLWAGGAHTWEKAWLLQRGLSFLE